MFVETKVPILGIIENMSYYICSHCGNREEIFGHGIVRDAAGKLEIPFLGEIPLDTSIREMSDRGKPVVLAAPESSSAKAFQEIIGNLAAQISIANYSSQPLEILEE